MEYLGDNAGLGLTSDQMDKILQFQDLTGIEDMSICRDVLQRNQWNLEVAVQEQLNIREGRPSLYATETRPPAVISDHIGQHFFYSPPTDGSGSGYRGFVTNIVNFFWSVCYNIIVTLIDIRRRLMNPDSQGFVTNPLQDVLDFIKLFREKYSVDHPVFYQGTYSQVLNDAKRELKFLLIYLHNDNATDTAQFCTSTLSDSRVVNFVNANFLFWGCSSKSGEGYKVCQTLKPGHYPYLAILVIKDNQMVVVSRMEGFCDAELLMQRFRIVMADFEVNLIQARANRVEQSLNRSLRAHQDEAFMESLRADQEKERRREAERLALQEEERRRQELVKAEEERRANIALEKINSVVKVPSEPDALNPNAVHVVFKLPGGQRLDRRFLKTHSLEAIFYFVFCHPEAPDSFEITTNFPKRVLHCLPSDSFEKVQTLEEAGLKNREVLFINDLDA